MKKLVLLIAAFLLSPVIVFASDIEIKSITSEYDYEDATVEVENAQTAVINFKVDGENFNSKTSYKLVIDNNTKNTYTLNLKDLNNKEMQVTVDKENLSPGKNEINLTITRSEIDPTFLSETIQNSEVELLLAAKEKINPDTGYTLIKAFIIMINLTVIAVTIYIKTKHKSAFYVLLLMLMIPGLIIAQEESKIVIKINTTINKTIVACFTGADDTAMIVSHVDYTFNYSDLILNNDKNDALQILLGTDGIKVTKDNIMELVNGSELFEVYEKNELEKHLSNVDPTTKELLPVEGKDNIGMSLKNRFANELGFVIYEDAKDKLEVLVYTGDQLYESVRREYEMIMVKVAFNKNNNDYLLEVQNNFSNKPLSSLTGESTPQEIYDTLENEVVPVLSIKNYFNKYKNKAIEVKYPDLNLNEIQIGDKLYTQEELMNYDFGDDYYYIKLSDYPNPQYDEAILYYPVQKIGLQQVRYFMMHKNNIYEFHSNSLQKKGAKYNELIYVDFKIGDESMVLFPEENICYSIIKAS